MKSQHRHELETNVLAQWLADVIDRARPYAATIVGAVMVVAAVLLGISYFSTSTTAREAEAWSTYNEAVTVVPPNMQELRQAAEEYPDSPMQQWADVTWADGQVWMASRTILQNREAAIDALNRATGTYQTLLQESRNPQVISRAHFGLGRVYELRNELDKAREEYLAVEGGFAALARRRAEELGEARLKPTFEWLATAQAPRRAPPAGPGVPGQRPEFSAGGLDLPAATGAADAQPDPGAATAVDDLFKDLGMPSIPVNTEDRYGPGDGAASDDAEIESAPSAADTREE